MKLYKPRALKWDFTVLKLKIKCCVLQKSCSLKFNSILPSSISLSLSTHTQSCPSLFNLFSPVHSYSILSSPFQPLQPIFILVLPSSIFSALSTHIQSCPLLFNPDHAYSVLTSSNSVFLSTHNHSYIQSYHPFFRLVYHYSILSSLLQRVQYCQPIFNHILPSLDLSTIIQSSPPFFNISILSTHIQSYPPFFRPVYHYSILSSLLQRVQYCQPISKPILPSSTSSISSTHIQSRPPLFDIFNPVRPYSIQSVLTFQPVHSYSQSCLSRTNYLISSLVAINPNNLIKPLINIFILNLLPIVFFSFCY